MIPPISNQFGRNPPIFINILKVNMCVPKCWHFIQLYQVVKNILMDISICQWANPQPYWETIGCFRIQSSDLWLEMSVVSSGYLITKNMTFYSNTLFYN